MNEVRTILHACTADRHAVASNNLVARGIPTVLKEPVLHDLIPSAELAHTDLAIGLVVHVPSEFGVTL